MKITGHQVVGLRIRALRGIKKVTQKELCDASGLYQVQLVRLESGFALRVYPPNAFKDMAKCLGVDESYLDSNAVSIDVPPSEIYILFEPDFQPYLKEAITKYKAEVLFTR